MVKLVGCRPWLWAVLLLISWPWSMSNITSKKCLDTSQKEIPSSIPSCTEEICLHFPQIPLQKWGIWDVTVGVFTFWYLSTERELVKKNPSWWNNQFSTGILTFYIIQNSINLIGTCLKIVLCLTYVQTETCTLLLATPSPCYYFGV